MKQILFALLFLTLQSQAFSQSVEKQPAPKIKQFWFVMLVKGNNRTQDSTTAAKIQDGHMANIRRLAAEGKLKVAGPFGDDGNWRGIFIFDCATQEETEQLLKSDPAIASGRLGYEIHPWYTMPTGSFSPAAKVNN